LEDILGSEFLIGAGKWLWENYGKDFVGKAFKKSKSFNWPQAAAKYRNHLRELYGTTKVLNREIKIQNLYTDVLVQDRISTDTHLEANEFQAHVIGQKSFSIQQSRKLIKEIALQHKRLFILGKPGSGKTTFLKYLTLQACMGKISKTPVFITLKDWSDSGLEIIEFMNRQFEICSFPDSQIFVEQLLSMGGAMILCDGLDEVEVKKRDFVISQLEWFSKKYINTSIFISCRLGAIDKNFERYSYVEIADFDEKQINVFARKWFEGDDRKLASFLSKLSAPDNQGLRELAQTPLLLALLCIVFEETLEFPKKKIDLYMRAVDVLLEKWDAKRGITRENEYFIMSRRRKENLLGYLATMNFEASKLVFEKEILAQQVEGFFLQLPKDEVVSANGESVLRTIQEHHGLIVERSQNLFSFSHLTFQEYFTAKYIIGNAANGSVNRLIMKYWNNDQWYEIFRMTFGMLDEGTEPINYFINLLNSVLKTSQNLDSLFRWSYRKATESYWNNITGRCLYSYLGLIITSSRVPDSASYAARSRDKLENFSYLFTETQEPRYIYQQLSEIALELSQKRRINLAKILRVSKRIGALIMPQDLELDWKYESKDLTILEDYLRGCKLLIDCLNTTRISNRENVTGQILAL
jgi:predicted NACHT family NTPase